MLEAAPLCDRHDDTMDRDPAGGFACSIHGCTRRYSPTEGYYSAEEPAAAHNRHPCLSCGQQMFITRFTAHGPSWRCGRCAA